VSGPGVLPSAIADPVGGALASNPLDWEYAARAASRSSVRWWSRNSSSTSARWWLGRPQARCWCASPFPPAPRRTGRAPLSASGSPVVVRRDGVSAVPADSPGGLALRITRPVLRSAISHHLPPFALWTAFPPSDYSGGSVAVGLAPRRRSRLLATRDVRARRRCPGRVLE
jgi:hypothetical protein